MIAIIAGTGTLPVAACQALSLQRKKFCVISLFPQENGTALRNAAGSETAIVDIAFYKASSILNHLLDHGVTQVLMIGKVDKQHLFKNAKLDWLAVKLLSQVLYKSDRDILQRIVDELNKHGITVLRQHDVLPNCLTKPGIVAGSVDAQLDAEVQFGMRTAMQIAQLGIGQTVIVKEGAVIAVEGVEGTDACIARGVELGNGNVIICKAAYAAHNPQFDLPTLGSATLATLPPGAVLAIAWQASHTLIVDYPAFVAAATALDITLVAV
jgi:DUF1009 family protein